uniref:Putative disease resistance protein RGA3 n=1 Tax=Aegilops tauschii TaxID=37682 RepID=M8BN03_AEGTA
MAMVLDAFTSYVGHMLAQLAADGVGTVLGVSGEIDKMADKLRDLKNFLADADRRNITDETVQEWVGQLKRAMYEATDILDLCQLKAMERGSSTTLDAGCFNPLLFCMRNPSHAHEIGTRIKKLNKRLDYIKERSAAFNFVNLGSYLDHSSNVRISHHGNPSRETVGDFDRSAIVGDKIEEDTRALVAQIMQTGKDVNNGIMVVAIVGVGGIGKTTLAQKVFNDEAIQRGFSKKIWLSVNQNFNEVELLRRAIIGAGGNSQLAGNAKDALHRALMQALKDHKTLLVMDDVWDNGAWEGVLKIPLANAAASGSRVLITTRDERVAQGVTAIRPYHHVDTLVPDDAWLLLKKQVCSSEIDEDHISTLKDIGLKIVQKCGCLPIAVKVMGGLLRERGGLHRDWQQVLDDSKWATTKMPNELNHTVYLSYEYMPSYLKQCFLYYSLLPKSRIFTKDEVVAMWISEGFIHGNSNDLEELGENYYKELVSRNLIEPDKSYVDLWVCSMHDVVRSFAQYMTKDEALVTQDGDNDILAKLGSQKFLRLSIETNRSQSGELDWKSLQGQQSVRTLISTVQIKMKPGDSLVIFSSLRTLHIESADVASLVESLHQLKHMRYLALVNVDISVLPGNIGKMKLLQFLDLGGCTKLVNLPDSIVKLDQLRLLSLPIECMVPRGFSGLTNMRRLLQFRAHLDGDWCSLDELGPLSQLRVLVLTELENVSAASFAANARLSEKMHLISLLLYCTSKLGDDGLVKEKEGVSEEEQQRIEKVLDKLCPPPGLEYLHIKGYFGRQLPSWMMSTSMVPLDNLNTLLIDDLACCTQLPNGLCQLPNLQLLQVASASFPRLNKLSLGGMVEWEEWEWEEQVQAMRRLEKLVLNNCRLRHFPPGLASNASSLKILILVHVKHLSYIESFPSVVELIVNGCPDLERITNLPNLQKLTIMYCPKLKVLERIASLERLVLKDYTMEKLPEYMRDIKPRHLQLFCRLWLLSAVVAGQSGTEWDKFSQVEHVKAYARDGDNERKWYVLYTRGDNYKLDSNISSSAIFEETLSSCMVDPQGFESVYKMRRSTFSYICGLVRLPFLEDMMARDHTFVDGRVMSLQDRVATAVRMLISGEPPVVVGSSLGVNESTVSLVTQRFIEAIQERAFRHLDWPYNFQAMEKIKCRFDKIHGLPNCCGVVHRAYFKFGSPNLDHEENADTLMQAVVDPDMRFTNIWFGASSSMNQSSLLHDSWLFKSCEKGTLLDGTKLKVSDGSDIGEYIIGDAGYPPRPWLLTPYQLEGDISDSKVEFNKRHSAATAMALRALERLKDTWKCLQGEGWHPNNQNDLRCTINTCCRLHNIVIDMEEEGAVMLSNQEENCIEQVSQLLDEDAVKVRDVLSQHLVDSRETLSSSMVGTQGFESLYKMRRSTFSYICSLVKVPLSEDMMIGGHTFVDGRAMSFHDGVAIALRMLNSGGTPEVVGSSFGVDGSTVSLLTQRFVKAMKGRAMHHISFPGSAQVEKIKRKFDKIHGLPNCCSVVHTTHIKFGSQNHENEENDGVLMQAMFEPDMRFTCISLGSQRNMNQSSMLHKSPLFENCERGAWLNGRNLKVPSGGGSEVKEYIIGDAGYPLRPWLLTPYQLENGLSLSGAKVEFNRRHSAATAVALRALARLKETWKCLEGEGWRPNNQLEAYWTVDTCCILHNIVIDMEGDKEEEKEENYSKQVRQLADEDAIRVRDALSQHLIECGGTLSSSIADAQGFESVYKMRRNTFGYVCSLVKIPFLEDMMARNHSFVDGRVMSLQDGVAIALRILNSGDSPVTIGSFLGVNESTASLVTQSFVKAMVERALPHVRWSYSSQKMEKMKRKFHKVHGMPNCCGVVHTTRITFGSQNRDHEENEGILMQAVLDPDMRFRDIYLWRPHVHLSSMAALRNSGIFKHCEKGTWLNGSKLKISSGGGSAVREYIIGNEEYSLRPWLLTPYQLESNLLDSDSKVEFNKRLNSVTTAVALRALARLKDMWKCLQGEGWRPTNQLEAYRTVDTCCMLHNIVIDMEEDGVGMPSDQEYNRIKQVWHVADDGVRVRDILSQHLVESGEEEEEAVVAASSSGHKNKEQEVHRAQQADRGKEKVHGS